MGQEAVLEFLKKNKLGTMKEIAKGTGVNVYSVWESLTRMQDIDVEKITILKNSRACSLWKIKGEKTSKESLEKHINNEN